MYHIYRTEGFVIGGIDTGESNRLVSIYTRELGMVRATVQGARSLVSRHRLHLRDYSCVYVGLVRGKNGWRLTNAVETLPAPSLIHRNHGEMELLARIAWVIDRLVQGEERNDYLFSVIYEAAQGKKGIVTFSSPEEKVTIPFFPTLEYLIVLRILHALGYMRGRADFAPLLASSEITDELLARTYAIRTPIVTEINRALKESHL